MGATFSGRPPAAGPRYVFRAAVIVRDTLNDRGIRNFIDDTLSLTNGLVKLGDALRPVIPLLVTMSAVGGVGAIGSRVANRLTPGLLAARRRFSSPLSRSGRLGLLGLGVGAEFAAAGIDNQTGDATPFINSPNSFKALRGTSGILSGAVAGGVAGNLILPGWGALGGGILGGFGGGLSAVSSANSELLDARLTKVGDTLSERLGRLLRNPNNPEGENVVGDIKNALIEAQGLSREKGVGSANSLFGFSPETFLESNRQSLKLTVGPYLGLINQVFDQESQRLAKSSPKAPAQSLLPRFLSGNSGLNRELVDVVSQIRNIPTDVVSKEITKSIHEAQQATRVNSIPPSEQQLVVNFGHLATSAMAAANSLGGLKSKSLAYLNVLNSNLTSPHINLGVDQIERLGSPSFSPNPKLPLLNVISDLGGEHGRSLSEAGKAVASLGSYLPEALSRAVSSPLNQDDDLSLRVRKGVEAQLREQGKALSPQLSTILESVLRTLEKDISHGGSGDVIESIRGNVGGYSSKLMQSQSEPIRDSLSRFGSVIEREGQAFVDGLVKYREGLGRIGEGRDRLSQLRESATRQSLETSARDEFRLGSFPLDYPPSLVRGPFRARQERLTGQRGEQSESPDVIGKLLQDASSRVLELEGRQREISRGGAGSEFGTAFKAVSEELIKTKSQILDYQTSLRNLTDTTTRNADALQRLNIIEQDRIGRLSLSENLFTGGFQARLHLNQARSDLPLALRNPSSSLTQPDRAQRLISYLRTAGGAKLPEFGGRTGNDTAELLLTRLSSQLGLSPSKDIQDKRDTARQEVQKNNADAVKAQEVLIKTQQDAARGFFESLSKTQSDFFRRLGEMLNSGKVLDLQNRKATVSAELGDLRKLDEQRSILKGVGISNDSQLTSLRKALPDLENLSDAQTRLGKAHDRRRLLLSDQGVKDVEREFLTSGSPGVLSYLDRRGFTSREAASISRDVETTQSQASTFDEASGIAKFNPAEFKRLLPSRLRLAALGATSETIKGIEGGDLRQSQERLRKAGFAPNLFTPSSLPLIKTALQTFEGKSFNELEKSLTRVTQEFNQLTETLAKLKAQNPDKVAGYSLGGSVHDGLRFGKPRGTDTVPAMLTPGEFVVNARQARKHRNVLEKINKGMIYRAEGGDIPSSFADILRRQTEEGLANSAPLPTTPEMMINAQKRKDEARNNAQSLAIIRGDYDNSKVYTLGKVNELHGPTNPFKDPVSRARLRAQQRREYVDKNLTKAIRQGVSEVRARNRLARNWNKNNGRTSGGGSNNDFYGGSDWSSPYGYQASAISNFNIRSGFANSSYDPAHQFGLSTAERTNQYAFNIGSLLAQQQGRRQLASSMFGPLSLGVSPQLFPFHFATGGMVDNVPALLTPGEFVMSRPSVQRIGAANLARMNTGGSVGQAGGSDRPVFQGSQELTQAFSAFGQASSSLAHAFTAFNGTALALTHALEGFPRSVKINGEQTVIVHHNGTEVFKTLSAEFAKMVEEKTIEIINQTFHKSFPDLGKPL